MPNFEFYKNLITVLSKGVGFTMGLFFVTIISAMPLGLCLAFASKSRFWISRAPVRFFVFIMRGTPLLLQLYFFYYGLPNIPFVGQFLTMQRFPAACLTFALNYAAYFCEIFRGGLLSVDKGQYEAARVLGFTRLQTTFKIVIPQMIKVVLPAVSNETITLVKDTALAASIGVIEILHLAKNQVNSLLNVTPLFIAALFYLFFNFILTKMFGLAERKYNF